MDTNRVNLEELALQLNSTLFERLKIIISSFNDINLNKANNKATSIDITLDAEQVKNILDELLGGTRDDGLANLIHDKTSGLLSTDWSNEANSVLLCLQKIKSMNNKQKSKPTLILTGANNHVKLVVLLTLNNKTNVYYIDPLHGDLNINKKTTNDLFLTYLRRGNEANSISVMFNHLEVKNNTIRLQKCNKNQTGWACLIYALMLIHDLNDSFLSKWDKFLKNINQHKQVLSLYSDQIESMVKTKTDLNVIATTNTKQSIKQVKKIDKLIDDYFIEKKTNITKQIEEIKMNNSEQKLKQLNEEEQKLNEKYKLLEKEIKNIEEVIRDLNENASLCSTKKDEILTTEDIYKQFITGQQRKHIEIEQDKKANKTRQNILNSNEANRKLFIENQLAELNELLLKEIAKINKFSQSKQLLVNEKTNLENKIKLSELSQKTKTSEITLLNEKLKTTNDSQTEMRKSCLEINSVSNEYYKVLLETLKKHKLDSNQINSIVTDLNSTDSLINSSTLSLEQTVQKIGPLEKKTYDTRREIESFEYDVNNNQICFDNENFQIRKLEAELVTYDSWYWGMMYGSKIAQLKSDIVVRKSNKDKYENELKALKRKIETSNKSISDSNSKLEKLKKNKLYLEDKLPTLRDSFEKKLKELNQEKNNIVKTKLINEIENFDKNLEKISLNIKNNLSEIEHLAFEIKKETEKIELISKEIDDFDMRITSTSSIKDDYQRKIKSLEDNLKVSSSRETKDVKKKETSSNTTIQKQDSVVDEKFSKSNILNDKEFEELVQTCNFNDQKWKLIYRGTRDGFKAINFHSKCDKKHNTLSIIKSEGDYIFGGYTGASWNSMLGFNEDLYSFIFSYRNSLNEKFLFECLNSSAAIYCNRNKSVCFGDGDFEIADDSNLNYNSLSNIGYSYGDEKRFLYDSDESETILAGCRFFKTVEIEVFQKDYESVSERSDLKKLTQDTNFEKASISYYYEIFNTLAINGEIDLQSFIKFLSLKVKVFKDKEELNEMIKLFEYIFHYFDDDKSGVLEFSEFLTCCTIFGHKKNDADIVKNLYGFLFDMADLDKNKTLDINEIEKLTNDFPIVFKKNEYLKNKLKNLISTCHGSIDKDKFLKILRVEDEDDDDGENY